MARRMIESKLSIVVSCATSVGLVAMVPGWFGVRLGPVI